MSSQAIAKLLTKIILPFTLLMILAPAQAATTTTTFSAGSINTLYLWADSANTDLTLISLSGSAASWTEFGSGPTEVFVTGAPAGPIAPGSGLFRIQFDYPDGAPSTFSFQYSGGTWVGSTYTQAFAGTFTFTQGSGYANSAVFTRGSDIVNPAAPVAIPASLYLLGSAFAGMLMLQRRRDGGALALANAPA